MIFASIAAFFVAILYGSVILLKWMLKKNVSAVVIYTHGLFAILGFLLLVNEVVRENADNMVISISLFSIAIIIGIYMFTKNALKSKRLLYLGVIHAFVAIVAFVILLFKVFDKHY